MTTYIQRTITVLIVDTWMLCVGASPYTGYDEQQCACTQDKSTLLAVIGTLRREDASTVTVGAPPPTGAPTNVNF